MEMEQKDCSTKVDKLIEKHAWIATERQLFGRTGTDYDFASRDPHKAKEELDKLQTEQSRYAELDQFCLQIFHVHLVENGLILIIFCYYENGLLTWFDWIIILRSPFMKP